MTSRRDPGEPLYKIVRGAVGMVPVVGPLLTELYSDVVADPAAKRRDALLRELLERIHLLEQEGLIRRHDIAGENDISPLILQAVQIAARSRGQVKLDAIRMTVMNGVRSPPSHRTLADIILNLVDCMTTDHFDFMRVVCSGPGKQEHDTRLLSYTKLSSQKGTEGLADPVTTPGTAPAQGWYTERSQRNAQAAISHAVIADLVSMGIFERKQILPDQGSNEPFGRDLVRSTDFGRVVYQHILSPDDLHGVG